MLQPQELIGDSVLQEVQAAIAEILGALDDSWVSPDAALDEDLGITSFELLPILWKIEAKLGVRLQSDDIIDHLLGDLEPDEFIGPDGCVTPAGAARARLAISRLDTLEPDQPILIRDLSRLFTVGALAAVAGERLAARN